MGNCQRALRIPHFFIIASAVAPAVLCSARDKTSSSGVFPHAQITESFCEGLTEAVRQQITQGPAPLMVRPDSTSAQYVFAEQEAIALGHELDARTVLTGTLYCEDSDGNVVPQDLAGTARLVLRTKLIDVPTGSLLLDAAFRGETPSNEKERRTYEEKTAKQVAEAVQRRLVTREP